MENNTKSTCTSGDLMAVKDALYALSGNWKLQILIVLMEGTKRFKEIAREVTGISDKMLSKELKDLEENCLINRKVHDSFPPRVEYSVTEHSKTLGPLMNELKNWGNLHRDVIIKKSKIN